MMGMERHKKSILCSLIVILLAIASFILISCGNPSQVQEENIEPKIKAVHINRGYQKDRVTALVKEPICLVSDANTNKCESIDIIIELDNPQRRTINMVYLNGAQYKKSVFSEGSDYQTVNIKQYPINLSEGEFKIKIDKLYYQTPNEQKLASKATRELIFLINPEFNLTLDISESNMPEGDSVITKRIKYGSRFNMPSDYEMQNEAGYGKLGYTFAGWFDAPNGEGNRYNALTDDYKLNKDITLYAHYDLTCEYEVVLGEDEEISHVKVKSITPTGRTNTSKKIYILGEYEGHVVKEIGEEAFTGMTVASYELPSSITHISKRAFANAMGVSIDLKNVQLIGEEAFLNVSSITLPRNGFPPSLKEIGSRAFVGCVWDTTLYNDGATSESKNLKTLVIPANIEKIGNEAFAHSKFTKVYFWDGIYLNPENAGADVFSNCPELQVLYTGARFIENTSTVSPYGENGLNIIGDRWFFNNRKMIIETGSSSSSVLTEGLETIGEAAFMSDGTGSKGRMNGITNIRFPNTLKEIKKEAFNNTALSQAEFAENKQSEFETLGEKAFQGTFINNMEFYSLKTFASTAFFAAPLEYLIFDLPEGAPIVKYLPHSSTFTLNKLAGHGMPRYTKIYVPEGQVDDYKDLASEWWFNDKGKLDEKYIQPILSKSSIFTLLGGDNVKVSYNKLEQGEGLVITNMFKTGSLVINGRVQIPAKINGQYVLEIGEYVVSDDGFTEVLLPSSIKTIHKNAFRDAENLYLVNWYDKDDTSYEVLENIQDIDLEEIGDSAFKSTRIEKFQSNNKLKLIAKNTFHSCKELKYIELLHGNQMEIKENVFANAGSSLPNRDMKLWINLDVISTISTGLSNSAFLLISNVSKVYINSNYNYLNPGEGFKYPIEYGFLGQSVGEVSIYFSEENQINLFLGGRANTYFNLGKCAWDLDGKPNTNEEEILYTKGVSP